MLLLIARTDQQLGVSELVIAAVSEAIYTIARKKSLMNEFATGSRRYQHIQEVHLGHVGPSRALVGF